MSTDEEPRVHVEWREHGDSGRTAHVTFDHARRLNVLGTPMLLRALEALEAVNAERELRALVITGAGEKAFIGGADIREFAEFDESSAVAFISRIHEVCEAIRQIPAPTLARVQGYCLGAGMEIAAACDMRAAVNTARFGMPEVRVGVPSVIEAALLPGLIGWGKTRELLLTGDTMDAEEARRCGFVEALTSREDLDAKIETWLASILQSGPEAIRLQKELIRKWEQLPLAQAIDEGIRTFGEAFRTDEPGRFSRKFFENKDR